jgi:hypothetical protein
MNESIFISGFFSDNDQKQLSECCTELENYNISLKIRNLNGVIMHSALDFADFEAVIFSYELVKSLYYSGCYDFLKFVLLKLWNIIKNGKASEVPFTIDIEGIPTANGLQNIKCKISGPLSKHEREIALERSFSLASQIENHQFELLKRGRYYDAFNAHVFTYDEKDCSYAEMDIDAEIQKRINETQERNENG